MKITTIEGHPDEFIVTTPTGDGQYTYRLASDICYDAAQFSALASSGFAALARDEYQPASDQLGTALALWGSITLKSQILPEAAGRPFAVQTREKLWQARKGAGIGKAAADINLGLHRRAAAELTLMADEWSHDREILRLLVIALHRCGLTEKVSEMCRAAIEATRELGLDDGPCSSCSRISWPEPYHSATLSPPDHGFSTRAVHGGYTWPMKGSGERSELVGKGRQCGRDRYSHHRD